VSVTILNNDCRAAMREMPEASVDSLVTDPPYGLSFMGKEWDHGVPGVEFWTEALRVAKPGAHLLAFGGTRTYHRLTCAIEDAGWEIRDCVMWVYGSGFPKSLNVEKAGAGSEWSGWGTALKPAWEPIIVARKPLVGTVASNVQAFGTGALNIDASRVGTEGGGTQCSNRGVDGKCLGHSNAGRSTSGETFHGPDTSGGRWPANLIHDGSEDVVGLFPQTSSGALNAGHKRGSGVSSYDGGGGIVQKDYGNDSGSAARFFYCTKASKLDRELGLPSTAPIIAAADMVEREEGSDGMNSPRAGAGRTTGSRNAHPTVKPTALMRYLCKLVTPPGGTVLDPFCGSGSTGVAARLEGFAFIGIDAEAQWASVARQRCEGVTGE